jgi:protein tyrosine phosphatase (PTP) superfamily phosphohydrolase (DUF442 family)
MSLYEIYNFIQVDDRLGTSGQPLAAQFQSISDAGYGTLINLATPDSKGAMPNEGEIVTTLGLTYVQIPVVWSEPRVADWEHSRGAGQGTLRKHSQRESKKDIYALCR